MSLSVDQIEAEARKLTDEQRAELASRLLQSFHRGDAEDAEEDRRLAEEALRRNEEIERGEVEALSYEEVMAELRAELGIR